MQRVLLLLLAAFCCGTLTAQVLLEDFEGNMADLPWNAIEGSFEIVANPDDTTSNPSAFVGSYTKQGDRAFSLFLAEVATPLDLSVNNQFSIQINAGAATQLLLKLEGTGEAIERTVNIPVANQWRTYNFDFSAAAGFTTINKIILFFDPGVETSTDTYLFDNLIASPAGVCAGTVPDPTILDDFECQRNASYSVGFSDIEVIANPDMDGNPSDSVGQYTDRDGAFYPLIIDYNGTVDLSVNNQLCLKVWTEVAGNLLMKLEGGVSAPFEVPVALDGSGSWVEVCADFSSQSAANHGQIVLFFNAGVDAAAGDIYYIDDLSLTPAPPAEALEDFEDGANLAWMPLNGDNTLHGTFTGPIANPDMTGNESDNIGQYVRGNSSFSTLTATLLEGIDLSTNPQLNLDVWAPDGATSVTMQLVSPIDGARSVEADIPATMSWQTLNFNFEEFSGVTDFDQINLLFDPETSGNGTYFFDNLIQGESTVDPCADVVADPDIIDDFECQRNANYTIGTITAVDNPDVSAGNPSTRVGEFVDPPGAFNVLLISFDEPLDLSVKNRLQAKIWSPVAGQILFKLEQGTGPDTEVFVDIPATNEWVDYEVDFSAVADGGYQALGIFFGAGTDNPENNTYYVDDLQFARAPYTSDCVVTFESEDLTLSSWRYFANGAFEGNEFIISDNPNVSDGNPSAKVGTFEEASDGLEFAGMFADPDAPIILPVDNKIVTMKVLMDVAGEIVLKLEGGPDEAPQSGDVFATYDTPGEWQELTFDMSVLPDNAAYTRITLIPNFGVIPMENLTHYFDDIAVGGGNCASTSIFNPVSINSLRVYPNPVSELLTIENNDGAVFFELTNMLGQRVKHLSVNRAQAQVQWPLEGIARGTYVLTARDANGIPVARTMIIRE
ncbi:T9SS type A sorting domain-containing protein [Lewinella sp. W8]|uniref:T9SS type A sorting domain-containing protein n=1 Tax=Lewinella sp. W8 TaxID=2528208 RepID=UPI001067514E|nr:T9SS type A sorting domain-containing protein [Lewinella sp. W8]MTB50366.1 T9SS type A sorting domain-containing protein [Lewinella sp. W8]